MATLQLELPVPSKAFTPRAACVVAAFVVLLAVTLLAPSGWPGMLVCSLAIFWVLKLLVWQLNTGRFDLIGTVAFFLLWPGFDVDAFLRRRDAATARPLEWAAAWCKTALAALLIWVGLRFVRPTSLWMLGTAGMLLGVLLLHCGVFHLAALAWRLAGRDVRPIMNNPLAASTLSDFWGRRWNLAFRDAASVTLFRPLARRCSIALATWLTYLASGLIHDLAISVPARGGYGLPSIYFLLQAAGLFVQRRWLPTSDSRRADLLNRAFTFTVALGPVPLLFHQPFAERAIVPLLGALGAI